MSFIKLCQLADEFTIKIIEYQFEDKAPELDAQAATLSLKERSQMKGHGPSNLVDDGGFDINQLDAKVWNRAKKTVKKYWNKYDEPWAVVYDVYRKMGGKPEKKKKKKS